MRCLLQKHTMQHVVVVDHNVHFTSQGGIYIDICIKKISTYHSAMKVRVTKLGANFGPVTLAMALHVEMGDISEQNDKDAVPTAYCFEPPVAHHT